MVECLTWDLGAVGLSLTSVTVLCPRARHIYPYLVLVQPRKTHPGITEKLLSGAERIKSNKQNYSIFTTDADNLLLWKVHIWYHAWLASDAWLNDKSSKSRTSLDLGTRGIGVGTVRASAKGLRASQGTFSNFLLLFFRSSRKSRENTPQGRKVSKINMKIH